MFLKTVEGDPPFLIDEETGNPLDLADLETLENIAEMSQSNDKQRIEILEMEMLSCVALMVGAREVMKVMGANLNESGDHLGAVILEKVKQSMGKETEDVTDEDTPDTPGFTGFG